MKKGRPKLKLAMEPHLLDEVRVLHRETASRIWTTGQNIDRCHKQFKMVQFLEVQIDAMQKLIGIGC